MKAIIPVAALAVLGGFLVFGGNWYFASVHQFPNSAANLHSSSTSPSPANTTSSNPSGSNPQNSAGSFITEAQAIAIVEQSANVNETNYNFSAYFKNDDWYVSFAPKQSTSSLMIVSGGNGEYIIDGRTGAIISKMLGQ